MPGAVPSTSAPTGMPAVEYAIQYPDGTVEPLPDMGHRERQTRLNHALAKAARFKGQAPVLVERTITLTYGDWTPVTP